MYEVGIIGGGAAGLAAALELSRRRISSAVIDSGRLADFRRCQRCEVSLLGLR